MQKFERTCYTRITKVVRYEEAERLCQEYGLQLAVIDNIPLLERLKQLNMCKTTSSELNRSLRGIFLVNATCRGECPTAKGYYIGLKRFVDGDQSKWIWSNNDTWIENQTNVTIHFLSLSLSSSSSPF